MAEEQDLKKEVEASKNYLIKHRELTIGEAAELFKGKGDGDIIELATADKEEEKLEKERKNADDKANAKLDGKPVEKKSKEAQDEKTDKDNTPKIDTKSKPSSGGLIREGSEGEAVKNINDQIDNLKAKDGSLFGDSIVSNNDKFDKDAIIKFQKDVGIKADGIVGNQTKAALDIAETKEILKDGVSSEEKKSLKRFNGKTSKRYRKSKW